jgi:hypothetical protein
LECNLCESVNVGDLVQALISYLLHSHLDMLSLLLFQNHSLLL